MTARQRFSTILFCFLIAMALLYSLLGHMAGTVWYFHVLNQFQLWAFWGGIIALLIALWERVKPAIVLALLLITSGAWAIAPVVLHELKAPVASGPAIKIINYNVLSHSPQQHLIAEWIRAQGPDVIALVEGNYRWTETAESLKDILPYSEMIDNPGNLGMILLSRYPLENLQKLETPPIYWPSMVADIALPQGRVRFIIAHSPTPVSDRGVRAGGEQIEAYGQMVAESPHPVVLMGDFNTVPWSQPYLGVMQREGLFGNRLYPTWPSFAGIIGVPIDQIVAGKGAVVSNISTGPRHESDHRARIAELHLIK